MPDKPLRGRLVQLLDCLGAVRRLVGGVLADGLGIGGEHQ
jgi:hypothetical protein